MKTFVSPEGSPEIKEFTYEGCRYSGIKSGTTFSVLSEGLANYLTETFSFLVPAEVAPIADNEFCCSKCGKDCGSKYMKERHEKVCTVESQGLAVILKPTYIFWNYKGLDRTQLTPDQLIPTGLEQSKPQEAMMNEEEISQPAPGVKGTAMIGKRIQPVTTDRDGVDWYGSGVEDDDFVNG